MKKDVLIVIVIFLLCIVAAFGACALCAYGMDGVQTVAHADAILRSTNGKVHPNEIPDYDLSLMNYISSYDNIQGEGLFTTVTSDNREWDSNMNAEVFFLSDLNYFDAFCYQWVCHQSAYYSFTTWYYPLMGYYVKTYITIMDLTSNTSVNCYESNLNTGSTFINSFDANGGMSLVNGHTYRFVVHVKNNQNVNYNEVGFTYIKLDKFVQQPANSGYSFTGFVVPGYTYTESGGGGSSDFDDWDGVVRANRLRNSSEFTSLYGWDIPSTAVSSVSDLLINVSTSSTPVLIKNTTSREFAYEQYQSITLSCYLTEVIGTATLQVANADGVLVGDVNSDLSEGLNYFTFELPYQYENPQFGIYLGANSSVSIDWVKLEIGDQFTGYIENIDELYDNAYSQGFLDGSNAYAFRSFDLNFDNVETNQLPTGWIEMGFSSEEEWATAFWSMRSYWFEEQGYNVTSSGKFNVHNDDLGYGFILYLAVGSIASPSELSTSDYPVVWVYIYPHISYFYISDSSFPNPWNPIQYPDARRVIVNCQLGVSQWLENVENAASTVAFNEGKEVGYVQGKADGKRIGYKEGLHYAETGNWRALFSALVSVPVSAITSFFDFEVLGFNFLNLFETIVTISIFLFLVRLLIGKVVA